MSAFSIVTVVLFLVLWFIINYYRFSSLTASSQKVWKQCIPVLKQRYQMFPIMINMAKNQAAYDQNNLTALQNLYTQALDPRTTEKTQLEIDSQVTPILVTLFEHFQKYPTLRQNMDFVSIEREILKIENQLNTLKQSYNGYVSEYNNALNSTANQIFAKIFRLEPKNVTPLTVF